MDFVSSFVSFFGDSGSRIGRLLKASLSVLKNGWLSLIPFLILFAIKVGRAYLLLYLLYLGFVTQNWDQAFPLMLVAMVYLPCEIIIQTFLQAAMSKMARDTLMDGKISWSGVGYTLLCNLFSLLFIGIISAFVRKASDSKSDGILGFLMALVMFAVAEVWDLISNFGISGIVVENVSIKTLVERLKSLRSHVPEALTGVLGIDLIGGAVSAIFAGGIFMGLFGGGAVGYFYADKFPEMFVAQFDAVAVNTLPAFILLGLSFTMDAIIRAAVVCAKSLYFTMLYMVILHPDKLPEGTASETENILSGAIKGAAA